MSACADCDVTGLIFLVGGVVQLVAAVTMLYFGIAAVSRAAAAKRTWVRITGRVSGPPMQGTFGSVINYPLPDGRVHAITTTRVKFEVLRDGQPVQLLVNPRNPTEAHLQGVRRGAAPVLVSIVGAILALSAPILIVVGAGFMIASA